MEKTRGLYCLLFCFFVCGITLGSLCAAGEEAVQIQPRNEFIYVLARNLPLFICVNFWGGRKGAFFLGLCALILKGITMGALCVAAIKISIWLWAKTAVPALIITVPAAVSLAWINLKKRTSAPQKNAPAVKLLQSLLACFVISCVEFAVLTYLPQVCG